MFRVPRSARAALFLTVAVCVLPPLTCAQSRDRRRDDAPTARELQTRTEKAEEALVDEYKDIASEFYRQGEKEMALDLLDRLMKLDPKMPGLKERIAAIREEMLQANETELEIDTSKGWGVPIALVEKDKPFRIASAGDYRIKYETSLTVEGLNPKDPGVDLVEGIAFGALIGVIATDGKIGDPFTVKSSVEYTPKNSGQLFLRVNVPAEVRCTGKLKVRLSGAVTTAATARKK
ncbi:MAG: hypothetical protein R3C19_26240 [Planctomycetaceae bacterium]